MTVLTVADEVSAAFPALRIDAVVAEGLRAGKPWPEVRQRLDSVESGTASGAFVPASEEDPRIAAWHTAYRAFGTNPRRERPSADALGRRLARTGRLPRINAAVDCYNLVSVTHGVPVGAFDLARVKGDITVRFARAGDEFTPLGEPRKVEHPRPGEVVYADDDGVLTRHWNHRDADRTKVLPGSEHVVFLLETPDAAAFGAVLGSAVDDLVALLGPHGAGAPGVHRVTPGAPRAELA